MPDERIARIDIRHFVFWDFESGERTRLACWFRRLAETNFKFADRLCYTLFLNPGDMPGGKLPTAIALDQCVGELHNSIERFAVRCSFHPRFSENNG